MATDNLNYYSAGLPAGQQTDRYSSQPGCLRSRNLDIFSSSKSVKATAWSTPVNTNQSGVVLADQTGNLILKTDGNVYDKSSGAETLVYTGVATNFPSYKVSYNGRSGTYNYAQWGTPLELISKYENGALKYFTIFTDKSRFGYSTVEYTVSDSDLTWTPTGWTEIDDGTFTKSGNSKNTSINLRVSGLQGFTSAMLTVQAHNPYYETEGHITITSIKFKKPMYWYNAETDQMEFYIGDETVDVPVTDQPDEATDKTARIPIPLIPDTGLYTITINFTVTPPEGSTTYTWSNGQINVDVKNYNEFYNYLPVNADRELVDIGEYYWEKGTSFQTVYDWGKQWANDSNKARVVRYNLDKYIGWETDVSMDIIGTTIWNEQVYMVGNMNGNGYIIPCDLTGGKGTPYIAYGCEFKGVTNIDYLLYLVGEDRGISTLWVFNNQELVPILGGKLEVSEGDLIGVDEQYNFDGKIINWRKNLILTTSDNRIFQYGQTYGGKGGSFVHELPSNAVITDLKANGNDLEVHYSVTVNNVTTKYSISYQDDVAIKNYNELWEAVYPIILGNHLLEKEESDLYASYILPNKDCSIEFWGMANHYHFWTFTSYDNQTLSTSTNYKLKGATGNYKLKFIERNGTQYTFRLEGDLPIQNGGWQTITTSEGSEVLNYTEFNHFRKIGEITTNGYIEGEFRFHNLNNKLELPKSHSLQIMAKGWGTSTATPELFSVDLVANQRDRG